MINHIGLVIVIFLMEQSFIQRKNWNAKMYHGKSLKERWDNVQIISIMGIPFDEWQIMYRDTIR